MSDGEGQPEVQQERQVRCSCGLQYGWFDADDADHLAAHHDENCDGEVEFKEREKGEENYSDVHRIDDHILTFCRHCDDGRDYECQYCGKRFHSPGPRDKHEEVCLGP